MTEPPMPTPFAAHFRLKNPEAVEFVLSPERDAADYVELNGEKQKLLANLRGPGRALALVEGDFGSGKSHLLRSCLAELEDDGWLKIWVELDGFNAKTSYFGEKGLHQQLFVAALALMVPLLRPTSSDDLADALRRANLQLPALERALRDLLTPFPFGGHEDTRQAMARAWLTSSRTVSPIALGKAGYSNLASEELGPHNDAVLLDCLAGLIHARTGRRCVLVLDEGNAFTNLRDSNAMFAVGEWMRTVADPDRRHLGALFGVVIPEGHAGKGHPAKRRDVLSRIRVHLKLPALGGLDETRTFMGKLWPKLTKDRALLPFRIEESALLALHADLDRLRVLYPGDHRVSLAASPSRRDLLHVLTIIGECATEAKKETVTGGDLREWFPEERS